MKYRRGVNAAHVHECITHIHILLRVQSAERVIQPGIRGSVQTLKGRLTQQAALNEAGQAAKAIMALPEKTHDC